MATAEQLKALVRSYSEGDNDRFLSIAMQIAAHAARTGKERLAQDLRSLVDDAKRRQSESPVTTVPIARPQGELAGLITATYPKIRLSDMVIPSDTENKLTRVLLEYRQAERLRAHALSPRRKLLLVGPPGCGKTMSATALAGELNLPLLSVQLHAVMSRYMGETAAKLHLIFDAMLHTRGVYLFDEFDAIGGKRAIQNDVGEIRRVLNSFLQFMERDDSDSIVIAATNLIEMLDTALFRRFDDVISYRLPSPAMVVSLVQNRLTLFEIGELDMQRVVLAATGLSHAEIARACDDAAKEAVLTEHVEVSTGNLISALQLRVRPNTLTGEEATERHAPTTPHSD